MASVPDSTERPVGRIIVVRHGSTEWSRSGRHTGRTDVPLDSAGRSAAAGLSGRLAELGIVAAWSSPLCRARESAALAGFAEARLADDLMEWDYGDYEGRTTAEIREERPDWALFRDGCPGGETLVEVEARCTEMIGRVPLDPEAEGAAALFAHGHLLRVLAATYLDLGGAAGAHFMLDTATVGILGFERTTRALRGWNA